MSPDEAADRLEKWSADLRTNLGTAARANLADLLETARRHSSGPLSTAELRRRDHPYARRHGAPQEDPAAINRQSGAFLAAWESEGPDEDGDDLTVSVFNTDWKAPLLEAGTRFMFERPLPEAVEAEVEPRAAERVEKALEDSFR